jgi:RNA polymerase sigma-70 factor (ECF subfamily)
LALVDGLAGAVVSVGGRPMAVFGFTVRDGRIAGIELLADPEILAALELEPVQG